MCQVALGSPHARLTSTQPPGVLPVPHLAAHKPSVCLPAPRPLLPQSLLWQLRQPPQGFNIVVMPFRHPLHPISPHQLPPEGLPTCLRVLRFAEGPHTHVVKNVLIDHAAIERTVGVVARLLVDRVVAGVMHAGGWAMRCTPCSPY